MAKFRTAAGLVDCTAFMRAASGLTSCAPRFYGDAGPVDAGGSSAPLAASVSPDSASGAVARSSTASVQTNTVTVTATGGIEPYAFAWGAQPNWTVNNGGGATASFTALAVHAYEERNATFTCSVTDKSGAKTSVTVTAYANNYGGGSGGQLQ